MKKLILLFIIIFPLNVSGYSLENGSKEMLKNLGLNTLNLGDEISRKEFVETLYVWYDDYKLGKGIKIDYSEINKLDNSKIFKDVDLNSDFGEKLSYFAGIGAFSKNQYFNPNEKLSQKEYFIIMRRLGIMYSRAGCASLRICEKEINETSPFLKGTYYKYTSKILDKSLRKFYSKPQDYINAGYKPMLSTNYNFPILGQSLNGCYAFTIRNILKYKYGIGVYVTNGEKYIGKAPNSLWYASNMAQFDKIVHVEKKHLYNIDTLINYLQAGEPLSVSYILEYGNGKKVGHVVAAYSFDEKGVWVSETVTNTRKRISWDKLFNSYGGVQHYRMFSYSYDKKENWTQKEIDLENKYNFLAGEK